MHDVAVALDVAVVLDADGARHTDPAQIVAAQVDQHQVLGAFLLVGQQLLLQQLIFFFGVAAPSGSGDRVRRGTAVLHGHECFRAGTGDRKCSSAFIIRNVEEVHVRAGVGHPQHPVHVDRLDVGVHLETLRGHHLECLAALDFTDQTFDDRVVLLHRALGTVDAARAW